MTFARIFAVFGIAVGLAGLAVQTALTLPPFVVDLGLGLGLWKYLSYFTVLSNSFLVLTYLSAVTDWRWLGWFRLPVTRAMMLAVMMLVMGFYHLLLAHTWQPTGWFVFSDLVLHYIAPLLYLFWWAVFQTRGGLAWASIPVMLLPTFIYFVYAMIRGAIVADYPYAIIEASTLGYAQVAINAVFVTLGLSVLCALAIVFDRLLARWRPLRNAE